MAIEIVPEWMLNLDDEDVAFMKRFLLASGSLKEIAKQYGVTYPTVRLRLDKLIQKNVEKMNKKRAKKGLPPAKVSQNASASLKNIKAQEDKQEKIREEKLAQTKKQIKDSSEYYNADAKPGSLAAKANMVQKYNEKHNK